MAAEIRQTVASRPSPAAQRLSARAAARASPCSFWLILHNLQSRTQRSVAGRWGSGSKGSVSPLPHVPTGCLLAVGLSSRMRRVPTPSSWSGPAHSQAPRGPVLPEYAGSGPRSSKERTCEGRRALRKGAVPAAVPIAPGVSSGAGTLRVLRGAPLPPQHQGLCRGGKHCSCSSEGWVGKSLPGSQVRHSRRVQVSICSCSPDVSSHLVELGGRC